MDRTSDLYDARSPDRRTPMADNDQVGGWRPCLQETRPEGKRPILTVRGLSAGNNKDEEK
jgi:hypothetical protein